MTKPYRVETRVAAPRDDVWRALTDPVEIHRWHGWDYDGLDAEIQEIYVDLSERRPPDRIRLADESNWIELESDDSGTLVRIVQLGDEPVGDGDRDELAEGWRSFVEQLRYYLERHRGEDRRTIFLNGKAVASELSAALGAKLPGEPWYEDRFQRGVLVDDLGDALVVLATMEPLDSTRAEAVHITVTTHDFDDAAFAAAQADWWSWWSSQVAKPEITVRQPG